MTDLSRVLYLLGDPALKRKTVRKSVNEKVALADNDEVLAYLPERGRTYFVVGDNPYGSFTVEQYISYNGRLVKGKGCQKEEATAFFRKVLGKRLAFTRKVSTLSTVQYRALALFTLITEKTEQVIVNFDGTRFSRGVKKSIERMASALSQSFDTTVCVTDERLISKRAKIERMEENGGRFKDNEAVSSDLVVFYKGNLRKILNLQGKECRSRVP